MSTKFEQEVMEAMGGVAKSVQELKDFHKQELVRLERKIEARANRQAIGLGGGGALEAPASAEELKAFTAWARTGDVEKKLISINVDPSGGYLMPTVLANQIAQVGAEEGAIRKLARVENPSSMDFEIPIAKNYGGANHVGETSTRSETATPDLAMFRSGGGALAAVAPVTNWAMQDSKYDLAGFIAESIGGQFGVTEAADFVVGDGISKSLGFTIYPLAATADATRAWGTIEKLHAGSISAISIDNLIDLRGKLGPRYRKSAAWVWHPDTSTALRKLKASTSGDYYWQPASAAGQPDTMLGLPVFEDVNMPTIASAAPVVALADWRKFYCVVDVGQPIMIRDQVTSKGKTLFYSEKRLNGGVLDFNAGKILVMSV